MTTGEQAAVLRYIRRVGEPSAGDSDRALLERFARQRDAAAFAALVRRHGPMVLGVCRRVLHNAHDADDAFQATFLLLVHRAGTLRRPEQLGPWLHGVAHRVALKARSLALRRYRLEGPLSDPPAPPADDLVWRDLRPVLDEAVRSLPEKYRVPFILCHLQGLTHAEAARHLGCPPGTIATRLSRAREQLRARLVRRGVTLSAGGVAAALAGAARAAVPPALVGKALRAAAPSPMIPAHVTALTEGVCQAMLMEKLRFVVLALVAAAAVGAVVLGYRSGAAEPAGPPPVISPAPAPVLPPPADPGAGPAVAWSRNFTVTAPTRGLAKLFAEAAERLRKEKAVLWLGKELPPWPGRCPLQVRVGMAGAGGATTFEFTDGVVKSRAMYLEGALDRLLISALPHEVTHTVFADHFGKAVVRWADEGGAVMSEDEEEQQRHEALARDIVATPGRAIPLRRLLSRTDFPPEVMALYAQGYSVTRFLVERKDRKTFLAFVKQGMEDGWDKAMKGHYDFRDVEALEDAWLADLRRRTKAEPKPIPPAPVRAGKAGEPDLPPPGIPPVTGLAVMAEGGRLLRLRELSCVYVPVERPAKPGEPGSAENVASYAPVTQLVELRLDAAQTPVYGMDGRRVDPKKLAELLRKETPVLIAKDGKMVDPFHLRLIKEGTLIVAPPVAAAPPLAPAASAAHP